MRRLLLIGLVAAAAAPRTASAAVGCAAPRVSPAYDARVARVLAAGRDVWGERLLTAAGGPTPAAVRRLLPPLLYALGRGRTRLTASGVYYLPFTLPFSVGGARGFGLHVADGSQIIVRRSGGPSLLVYVGRRGRERYGSCLRRLGSPALADGYLPILDVDYRDATGVRYHEESFVGRVPHGRSLASYLRIAADATGAGTAATIRLVGPHGRVLTRTVRAGGRAALVAVFVHTDARLRTLAGEDYTDARASVGSFWRDQLGPAPMFVVPESQVMNAERALLVEELEMTWRYSVGNAYEELSYAEALDVSQLMAEYGYGDVARQILRFAARQLPARFTNWRAGERLVAGAAYYRLTGDARYVEEETPALRSVVARLRRALAASGNSLLPRERYSSDIGDHVYSLQGQTAVWQGLRAMGAVWAQTGHRSLAVDCVRTAALLARGLHRAVRASARRLPDGSLFVPAALLDGGRPFGRLTTSIDGTYWNLVVPYALASGFFAPHGSEARGLLRYLMLHGSRLLGLVRAGAYRLASGDASASGTDQVYGFNVARFLADNDEPDQLVLSLYGTLAGALTPGTYVAGEAATVAPLGRAYYRSMYLPPNNDAAATFLETLRATLVHETRDGLELAFATPRAWLADGKSIQVDAAPTRFGPVTFSLRRTGNRVDASIEPPPGVATLRLRLRLPAGGRLVGVEVGGRPVSFDRSTGTVELSGRTGPLALTAMTSPYATIGGAADASGTARG